MNVARENILSRVRRALRTPGHQPLAPTGQTIWPAIDNPWERFQTEFAALKGELITDLPAFLAGFPRIASDVPSVPGNSSVHDADLGVTGCDCVIAQTGSIAVSTRSAGGRALSVWPPVHLVIARRDQLVPDLKSAMDIWRTRYDGSWPSNLCLITGPSRTGDIEKILVMGAHGPKRLAIHFHE